MVSLYIVTRHNTYMCREADTINPYKCVLWLATNQTKWKKEPKNPYEAKWVEFFFTVIIIGNKEKTRRTNGNIDFVQPLVVVSVIAIAGRRFELQKMDHVRTNLKPMQTLTLFAFL